MQRLMKNWLPHIILKKLKKLFGKKGTYFTGEYKSWDDTKAHCKGYDDIDILNKVLNSTLKVKRGEVEYEREAFYLTELSLHGKF